MHLEILHFCVSFIFLSGVWYRRGTQKYRTTIRLKCVWGGGVFPPGSCYFHYLISCMLFLMQLLLEQPHLWALIYGTLKRVLPKIFSSVSLISLCGAYLDAGVLKVFRRFEYTAKIENSCLDECSFLPILSSAASNLQFYSPVRIWICHSTFI